MINRRHWTLDDIPWSTLRRERVAGCEELLYMVASASFIETTSDLYTHNLVRHFAGDAEVSAWLEQGWEPEELQHGRALRKYLRHAWPEFDWEACYAGFYADYGRLCKPEMLLPERSLELAARCVVEMGTASYYTALHHVCDEPVLAQLAQHIFQDEVGHYKYFYKYFRRYRDIEHPSRTQVLGALWHRLLAIDSEDGYIALKHVHAALHPDKPYDKAVQKEIVGRIRKLAGKHVPHRLAVNMLLKPLELAPIARRLVQPAMEGVARLVA